MKLVYVSGLYLPGAGGGEISAHTMLTYLASLQSHSTRVLTSHPIPNSSFNDVAVPGIEIIRVAEAKQVPSILLDMLTLSPADALLTQGPWSDLAIRLARESKIPSIFFLRSTFGELDISSGSEYAPDYVFANSPTVRDYIVKKWRRLDSVVVRPSIALDDYKCTPMGRSYITMINPVRVKGGFIMRDIASLSPQRQFLVVRGWNHLRKAGGWDEQKLVELADSNRVPQFVPEEANFDELSNVEVREATEHMSSVYAKTRVLLVPSIVQEGLPRVAIEAMVSGVPVIASAYGVRSDVIRDGGIRVADYENPLAWLDAIAMLDDADFYAKCSRGAVDQSSNYDSVKGLEPLVAVLRHISDNRTRL